MDGTNRIPKFGTLSDSVCSSPGDEAILFPHLHCILSSAELNLQEVKLLSRRGYRSTFTHPDSLVRLKRGRTAS